MSHDLLPKECRAEDPRDGATLEFLQDQSKEP